MIPQTRRVRLHLCPRNMLSRHWFQTREPSRFHKGISPREAGWLSNRSRNPKEGKELPSQPSLRCRIRLALKCFHGRRSRGGFNGRLRGFWWIISGGTKKRRSAAVVVIVVIVAAVATTCMYIRARSLSLFRCEKPWQRGSVTRLHGVGYARYTDNPTTDWPFANEPGQLIGYEILMRSYSGYGDTTSSAARKQRDPEDPLEDLFYRMVPADLPRWSQADADTRYTACRAARIIISWSCLATEVSFIVIFPSRKRADAF